MKYFYRDFSTDKTRWTAGKFAGWTKPTGLLNARYAIFARRSDVLLVPIYALTKETRAAIPNPEPDADDTSAIALWLKANVPTVENDTQARSIAHMIVTREDYDRSKIVTGNQIAGYKFDIPAPSTLQSIPQD